MNRIDYEKEKKTGVFKKSFDFRKWYITKELFMATNIFFCWFGSN